MKIRINLTVLTTIILIVKSVKVLYEDENSPVVSLTNDNFD